MSMTTDPQHQSPADEVDNSEVDNSEVELFNSACLALIESVFSLVPDYARELIRDYERRRGERNQEERRVAMREVIGTARNESDARVIKAGLNAVVYATWAMRDAAKYDGAPFFFSCNLYGEASRLLGAIQGHLGTIPDYEELVQQSRQSIGRRGGEARAADYQVRNNKAKALYAQWQSGTLKIPNTRPGRRVEDFDDYAAGEVGVADRTIREWRSSW